MELNSGSNRSAWSGVLSYVWAVFASLVVLAAVGECGYLLHPFFPHSLIKSSDVLMVLVTVIVAVANVNLVRVTKEYTGVANESIKLATMQNDEALAIRFEQGLQFDPPDVVVPHRAPAKLWVANLGLRSILVQEITAKRHDRPIDTSGMLGEFQIALETISWNAVIAQGEKRLFDLPQIFWKEIISSGSDVEVRVTVGNGGSVTEVSTCGFKVCGHDGWPTRITRGFGALRECPQCPNCNSGMDKFFKAAGANSFAEVEEKWTKPIQEDFARTCPNHKSSLASDI